VGGNVADGLGVAVGVMDKVGLGTVVGVGVIVGSDVHDPSIARSIIKVEENAK